MAVPIVAWQKISDTTPNTLQTMNLLNYGVVDAGSFVEIGADLYLTNNYFSTDASYSDVSKMENVRITTKDTSGGLTGDVILEKWISFHCDDLFQFDEDTTAVDHLGEPNFFPVGAETTTDGGGNPVVNEVAAYVCASLTTNYEGKTTPTSPSAGQVWRDITNRYTSGDVIKRYDTDTNSWKEIYEVSGNKWTNANPEDNKANRVKLRTMATVPSSALAGVRQFKTRARYSFI